MKNGSDQRLTQLNGELYTEFMLQELEQRLETDPLMLIGFLSGAEAAACKFNCPDHRCQLCSCHGDCPDFDFEIEI